jgi:hypothetical protein
MPQEKSRFFKGRSDQTSVEAENAATGTYTIHSPILNPPSWDQ